MTDDSDGRSQSAIQFPYVDLQGAIEVAQAVLSAGGVPLDRDQLAAALQMAPGSGGFSIKIAAARMFGLLEMSAGKNQLSPLGFEILDSARAKGAMAQAFLNVPLYKKVFDEFKGRQLPPRPAGLEQAFVNFGVAPKQKDRARNVFDRSARQAGFFPNANEDRLVMPVITIHATPIEDDQVRFFPPTLVQSPPPPVPSGPTYHPFVEGLLRTLPGEGEDFPIERRTKWLELAANAFDMIYGHAGDIHIAAEPQRGDKR